MCIFYIMRIYCTAYFTEIYWFASQYYLTFYRAITVALILRFHKLRFTDCWGKNDSYFKQYKEIRKSEFGRINYELTRISTNMYEWIFTGCYKDFRFVICDLWFVICDLWFVIYLITQFTVNSFPHSAFLMTSDEWQVTIINPFHLLWIFPNTAFRASNILSTSSPYRS